MKAFGIIVGVAVNRFGRQRRRGGAEGSLQQSLLNGGGGGASGPYPVAVSSNARGLLGGGEDPFAMHSAPKPDLVD